MTGPWISGESLSPSRLNLHQGGATLVTGFSTDTLQGQSGLTVNVISDLSVQNTMAAQRIELGGAPSSTSGLLSLRANSAQTDHLFLQDSTGVKSNFLLGLRTGDSNFSQVDGLSLYDASHNTMIARFSNESIRFYPPVVAPVFDTGGALSDTYNAALFAIGSSRESQIQAAIIAAAADGVSRVYLPASLYPYSAGSVSFDSRVQMVREGGSWNVYDVQAYGASGNGTTNDSIACQSATAFAPVGATVFFPSAASRYRCSNITVQWRQNIVGEGRGAELYNNLGGATMLIQRHPTNSALWNSENQLDGMEVRSLFFNSNRAAAVEGLRLERLDHSSFQDLHFEALNGPALHLASIVRESAFINITTRWCGSNATTPALLMDDAAGSVANGEGHNALNFFGLRLIFGHGPCMLIETTGSDYSNAQNKTRDIHIYGYQFHGPLLAGADFNGLAPFPDSALTHPLVVLKSCRDVRFLGGHAIVSGQSCAHFDLRGGTGTNSGCTGIVIAHGSISGHAGTSAGTLTGANSGVSVNTGCGVYLDDLWINAYSDITVGSAASVHLGLNVDLQGTPSINSLAYEPPNRLTGSFQPRSGQPLFIDEAYRLSVGTVKARSNHALLLQGSVDSNIAAIIVQTQDGVGAQASRMRFGSGTTPITVSTATFACDFPFMAPNGSATNPAFAFSSESSLGFYRSTASTVIFTYGTLAFNSNLSQIGSGLVSYQNGNVIARTGTDAAGHNVYFDVGTLNVRDGLGGNASGGRVVTNAGSAIFPTSAVPASELSLGFYRSGVSTMALSYGSFNLNQARLVSMRTAASLDSTSLAVNEAAFTIVAGSAAQLAIRSGGTVYYFASSSSTKG